MGNRDKKVLIIISDGGDNASKHKFASALRHGKAIRCDRSIASASSTTRTETGIRGYSERFAEETGGETFLPESAKDVVPICERIARRYPQSVHARLPTHQQSAETEPIESFKREQVRRAADACQSAPAADTSHRSPLPHQRRLALTMNFTKQPLLPNPRGQRHLRWIRDLLFLTGVVALSYLGFTLLEAKLYQATAKQTLVAETRSHSKRQRSPTKGSASQR